ncbi:MAG: hypothetical protein ACOVQH_10210 [Burkholderiaceae bacterium]
MSDEYDVYIEQAGFSLDLEIETGAAGAPGIQGPVGPPITVRELDGSPTVSATELVLPNGTLTVSGSVATVANLASLGANAFTAKQSFSGTDHVGLCLQSLTTAQYNALTAANGDLFRDSTADRIDARLASGTEELLDTRGNQTVRGTLTVNGTLNAAGAVFQLSNRAMIAATASSIVRITDAAAAAGFSIDCTTDNQMTLRNRANSAAGNLNVGILTASGLLDLRKGTTANILQFSSTAFLRTDTSQLSIFDTGLGRNNIALWRGGHLVLSSLASVAACSGADATGSTIDVSLSRASATTWQFGDGGLNANGSVNFANATATGTITGGLASTPVTFSVLNASSATATLGLRRITDRSNRLAYPDGTNWRFVSDDSIIS